MINLSVARVVDVKDENECLFDPVGVDIRSGDIGDQLQVALGDSLEARDGGTVEQLANGEEFFVDGARGNVEVLLNAGEVGESNVKELDVFFRDVGKNLSWGLKHVSSCWSGKSVYPDIPRYRERVSSPSHECFGDVTNSQSGLARSRSAHLGRVDTLRHHRRGRFGNGVETVGHDHYFGLADAPLEFV